MKQSLLELPLTSYILLECEHSGRTILCGWLGMVFDSDTSSIATGFEKKPFCIFFMDEVTVLKTAENIVNIKLINDKSFISLEIICYNNLFNT